MSMEKIRTVSVIGPGAMGRQIGLHCALKGFPVSVVSRSEQSLEKARAWCADYLAKQIAKGRLTQEVGDAAMGRIAWLTSVEDAVKDCDLVIEAVVEKEDVKRELFTNLSAWAREDAILTSNSSYMPTSMFVDIVKDPGRMANLHFFNPALRMELVEIVRGEHTTDETVALLRQFVADIQKSSALINKEIEGFIVNRMLRAAQNEAVFLMRNGYASFQDIDTAVEKGLNWPMGPFRLMDLTGLDLNYFNRQRKFAITHDYNDEPFAELRERVERGDIGRKAGKGWYDYTK